MSAKIFLTLGNRLRIEILRMFPTDENVLTLAEIASALDISSPLAQYHINKMCKAGLLTVSGTVLRRNLIVKQYQLSAPTWVMEKLREEG